MKYSEKKANPKKGNTHSEGDALGFDIFKARFNVQPLNLFTMRQLFAGSDESVLYSEDNGTGVPTLHKSSNL